MVDLKAEKPHLTWEFTHMQIINTHGREVTHLDEAYNLEMVVRYRYWDTQWFTDDKFNFNEYEFQADGHLKITNTCTQVQRQSLIDTHISTLFTQI